MVHPTGLANYKLILSVNQLESCQLSYQILPVVVCDSPARGNVRQIESATIHLTRCLCTRWPRAARTKGSGQSKPTTRFLHRCLSLRCCVSLQIFLPEIHLTLLGPPNSLRCLAYRAQRGPLVDLPKAKRSRTELGAFFNMKHNTYFGRDVRQLLRERAQLQNG